MTRDRGLLLYRLGLVSWVLALLAFAAFKMNHAPSASWWLVTFPLWGPPAAFVAWQLAMVGLGLALALLWLVFRPWLR
jgi:hypothetical protein